MKKKFFIQEIKKKKKKLCNILWFYNEIAVYIFIQAYSVLIFFLEKVVITMEKKSFLYTKLEK